MRDFDWEPKLLTIWDEYKNRIQNLNDQHVVNIMLHKYRDLLYRLPCQFNYMDQHCTLTSPCQTAQNSSVQIIHGAGGHFTKANPLRYFYLVYRRINVSNLSTKSNAKFRAAVQKSFNNSQYKKPECHAILREIIK